MRDFVRKLHRFQDGRRTVEIAAVGFAAHADFVPLIRRQALREIEAEAVATISDSRRGEVRTMAVRQYTCGERLVDQDQESQRRFRLRLVLGPAGDPVTADLVEKAAQHSPC